MLHKYCGFVVVNNSGQTLTYNSNGRIALKITRYYVDDGGNLVYDSENDDAFGFIAASTLADGAEANSATEYNNTADLDVGMLVQLEVTHDEGTLADGTFDLYYEAADASGELPSDADGYDDAESNALTFVGSLTWHSSGGDDEVMRSPVFAI